MLSASGPDPKQARGWYARSAGLVAQIWKFSTRAAVVLLVLLLGIPLYAAIFDRSFVIGEFSVPDELKKDGVTSSVIGRLFFDRIAEMQRVAKSAVAEAQFGPQAFGADAATSKVADIKLPGADISLATLVSQLRALLHIEDTKIVGEIVLLKDSPGGRYLLRAHATGGDVWVEKEEGNDIGPLISVLATRLVERFDPLVAGFYYFRTPKTESDRTHLDDAIGFADGFHSKDKRQQVWALVLRGLAWREKQRSPEDVRASLCTAIKRDPSFIPAWRILAGSLRDDGSTEQALDLALRLVHSQPTEPEGYRQLGALRRDCTAGPEEEAHAIGFFARALELGGKRGRDRPDYLSRVDYARFLYTWYKPPSDQSTSTNYLDLAALYLDEAQMLAPNEASIYTNWARALGHPRTASETGEPRGSTALARLRARHALAESRLLEAELKARYAVTLDSTSPFANLVMGELLTDQGIELQNYALDLKRYLPAEQADEVKANEAKAHEKFVKAKEYIDISRNSASSPEPLYEAIYARALAASGGFDEAERMLARRRKTYLSEWVHGEILYNQKRYEEALAHLNGAEAFRTCGPRSNVVRDMIAESEAELAKAPRTKPDDTAGPRQIRRTALTRPVPKHEAKPLPDPEPACPDWQKLQADELSPWPAVNEMVWL